MSCLIKSMFVNTTPKYVEMLLPFKHESICEDYAVIYFTSLIEEFMNNKKTIEKLLFALKNPDEESECIPVTTRFTRWIYYPNSRTFVHCFYYRLFNGVSERTDVELKQIESCKYHFDILKKKVCMNPRHQYYTTVDRKLHPLHPYFLLPARIPDGTVLHKKGKYRSDKNDIVSNTLPCEPADIKRFDELFDVSILKSPRIPFILRLVGINRVLKLKSKVNETILVVAQFNNFILGHSRDTITAVEPYGSISVYDFSNISVFNCKDWYSFKLYILDSDAKTVRRSIRECR